MKILDTNYEQNRDVVKASTLTYSSGHWAPKKLGPVLKVHPMYASIQANNGMEVPAIRTQVVSPFYNDNPDLATLFGFHIYDKKFGFNGLKLVNYVLAYPYMDEDTSKYGNYYDYDGVLAGYVLNGIKDKVVVSCGNDIINYETINDDDITNPTTNRLLYTDEREAASLPYGYYTMDTASAQAYQYIDVNSNSYSLTATDGYGEDAEVGFDSEAQLPNRPELEVVYNSNSNNLVLDDTSIFNKFKVFNGDIGNYITCTEDAWVNCATNGPITGSYTYGINIITNSGLSDYDINVNVSYKLYTASAGNSKQAVHMEYQFKLNENTYNAMFKSSTHVLNKSTKKHTNSGDERYKHYKVIAGDTLTTSTYSYKEEETDDGGAIITYYSTGIDGNNYYVPNQFTPVSINGTDYIFNFDTSKIQKKDRITSVKQATISILDGRTYTAKLSCGSTVAGAIVNYGGAIEYKSGTKTVDNIDYYYAFSNLQISSSTNVLDYPQASITSIFNLFDDWTNKSNIIAMNSDNTAYEVAHDIKSVFFVGLYKRTEGAPIDIYSYSPKYCMEIPVIYYKNDGTKKSIFVTGEGDWTNDTYSTNIYLRYYDFTITLCTVDDDGNVTEVDTLDKPTLSEVSGKNGYTFKFSTEFTFDDSGNITNKFIINDCTNLSIKGLKVTSTI